MQHLFKKSKKNLKKVLTLIRDSDNILNVAGKHSEIKSELNMERYRSGHNEAVLKTVCPQGRVGSNPTLSVSY